MHVNAHLDVDLVAVESTDTVTVMLELRAPDAPSTQGMERPVHTAVVVLDRSGSMSGHPLASAKQAIVDLVARLDDRDNFALITFDDTAQVVVPAGAVGVLGRAQIAALVTAVAPGGMTDLSAGYLRGLQECRRVCGPAGATIVLLSDGHANAGVTDPDKLGQVAGKAGAQAITTSTIGIGQGYDERLLAAIARGGNGNHVFANDADAAAAAVAGEVEGLLSKTVQAASLLITPTSDVTVIKVLNDLPSQAVAGGVMVELGDFYAGEDRKLLIELTVPAMAGLGLAQIADLRLTYVELPELDQHTVTLPISVNVVPADLAAGRVPAPEVTRERLMLAAQAAKRESEEALRRGDIGGARTVLGAAAQVLSAAPAEVLDAELRAELDWLGQTEGQIAAAPPSYSAKRLRSDATRKSRGYKSRTQGGEVTGDPKPSGGQGDGRA